ncbi:hypothetical protein SAMD00019534_028140 [Acytostelium subglobosum LB1]|uniref:hypothetical protein n=1 Tax=Acytostelium subglobosum LB1 TaxID=1410327 RepID=UPI000644A281|nr:hypothetical protein SAMD00019534_028140 [Acytostelium subglobosum LB1]GAM19639.1 hypothetical protein SAMD00019534_028140 [Acytostelium subglobosum LB1]|eukprot:XP_012756401.1 hypothetical protein SAMD00019534_028140 [Acytostelium subglobosum LB1]
MEVVESEDISVQLEQKVVVDDDVVEDREVVEQQQQDLVEEKVEKESDHHDELSSASPDEAKPSQDEPVNNDNNNDIEDVDEQTKEDNQCNISQEEQVQEPQQSAEEEEETSTETVDDVPSEDVQTQLPATTTPDQSEQQQTPPTVTPQAATQSPAAPQSPSVQSEQAAQPVVSSVVLHHGAKLIQVTGSKEPFYFIPVPLTHKSLNKSDAFIMQSDSYMFVWATDKCHSQKKAKAIQMAQRLKAEIGCQRAVQALEVGEEHPTFLWCLGVAKGAKLNVRLESSDLLLDEDGTERGPDYFLYRVGKVDGKLNCIPIEEPEITQEMLVSTSCFILDCEFEMYVWQGDKSSMEEKEVSMTLAKRFLTMFERPSNTIIQAEFDGAEGCLFKSKFKQWKEKERAPGQSYLNLGKKKEALTFDVKEMHADKEVLGLKLGANDNKGKRLVWSCVKGQWKKVEEEDFGIFFSNRSYVCNYIYRPEGKNSIKSIIFYWEGCYSSSRNYISYKFGLFKDIQKKMQALQADDPIEFRITQNKEPQEFIQLFEGETIVLNDELSLSRPMMFQVRGVEGNIRGTELNEISAARLCSTDSFSIIIPKKCILVWHGKASSELERQLAADLYTFLPPEYESGMREIEEGSEPESFWKIIGGKLDYAEEDTNAKPKKTKLFLCTENSGIFKADEVKPFAQVDLNHEESCILDRYNAVYVWKGCKTTESKFKLTMDVAQEYIATAEDGRSSDQEVIVVTDGDEPLLFRSAFMSWKASPPKVFVDPLEVRRQKALEDEKAAAAAAAVAALVSETTEPVAAPVQSPTVEAAPEVVAESPVVEVESPAPESVTPVALEEAVEPPTQDTELVDEPVEVTPPASETKPDQVVPEPETTSTSTMTTTIVVSPTMPATEEVKAEEQVMLSDSGDLLFAYPAFQGSPKSASKKGNKKKKPRNRSLSQNNTPISSAPISKSCELPPPPFSLDTANINNNNNNNNNSNNNNNNIINHSPRKRNGKHNRTGSHGSPIRIPSNTNLKDYTPKNKSGLSSVTTIDNNNSNNNTEQCADAEVKDEVEVESDVNNTNNINNNTELDES